ncbi:MAG TPA: hypothetical protein VHG09_12700, partial [Longimicrobiales bacterium]|nr:hypothetical protein [Longimicrobiales bacterium]
MLSMLPSRSAVAVRSLRARQVLRAPLLFAVVCFPLAGTAATAEAQVKRTAPGAIQLGMSSGFTLAASPVALIQANEVLCAVINDGATCTDVFPTPGPVGFVWPKETRNNFMFGSGPQITGIVSARDGCTAAVRETSVDPDCFAWSGDTTGAFFHDPVGRRVHGAPLAGLYDSSAPGQSDAWPDGVPLPDFPSATAIVDDTTVFHEGLIGRQAVSLQDTWAAYWEAGNLQSGGRPHPLGVLIEQRTLAWDYPDGNEATIFFVYRITNITDNPRFQSESELAHFAGADRLPDEGWRLDSLHFSFVADPDVSWELTDNHLTAAMPFDMM